TTAVANGDLSKKITVDVRGEILELKNTINTMVDQLNSFASEVTRVAREVGTEGKLGGQAQVQGVGGTWRDLTENVNSMAGNLTAQVRGIAHVVTAVANGDLKRKLALEAKGEIATLADTINEMINTLATFADQVTTVAREVGIEGKLGGQARVPGASGTWRDLTDNVNQLAANLTTQIRTIAEIATAVTKGDLNQTIAVDVQGELADLKDNINQMIINLRETTQKNTEQDWLKTNLAKFTRMLQGQRDLQTVSKQILSELAPLVRAQHGVFYLMDAINNGDPAALRLLSSYAYRERKHLANKFLLGEGLVGQAALEKERILLTEVPQDYIKISSALGEATPLNVVVLPVVFEGDVTAVIELASFHRFSDIHLAFMDQLTESIGIVLNTIAAGMRTEELLKQSQSLAEELQGQQQELTETNRRLEQQARSLQASEELLKQQREQLQQTNEELEEKAELLSAQNREVERKNREIDQARQSLEEKAEQLSLTSKYKNEFLANMSHELRTPLNSLLILSKLLTENSDKNLTEKQVEFASTIHAAGSDLLSLINDILDLAKIESGTMGVDVGEVSFSNLTNYVERTFRQVAHDQSLDFKIEASDAVPTSIVTDSKRLQQILRNLLANAFKFTANGGVELRIDLVDSGWNTDNNSLNRADSVLAFSVHDTGIGIAPEKQRIIFEAFQQADGTTSRKYGGTGLGLSISREIARLLGGEIRLISAPDKGSTFILYLPQIYDPSGNRTGNGQPSTAINLPSQFVEKPVDDVELAQGLIADDRNTLDASDRVMLIVDDDVRFAKIMLDLAHEQGFKGIVATQGDHGLALARKFKPDAITLDIQLPMMDGWTVLDRLKHDPSTRHIPVHIITVSEGRQRGLHQGAIAYLQKPATREALDEALTRTKEFMERGVRNLLIVEDNAVQRQSIIELIGDGGDVRTTAVGTGAEALAALKTDQFDCMVLDLGLPDMSGFELIEHLKQDRRLLDLPIIVYTAKDLSPKEETELKRVAETIIVKDVSSMERLLAETALFLHRVEANLPQPKQRMLEQVLKTDPLLLGQKVLIVDDDVRNIFALTSVLERHQMQVLYAENGRDGIELLQSNPDITVVLMDIMMPGMDGYETIREIRTLVQFRTLPIIALTAKAMKGDREKCIEAGASDYITKPVDTEQLMSLLRVWMYR
ncbi:MAG: response regulator, partial [Herpetosiphonaceae bacterium]|nr:response regulator [Herpetosiphonaceae bacterium]